MNSYTYLGCILMEMKFTAATLQDSKMKSFFYLFFNQYELTKLLCCHSDAPLIFPKRENHSVPSSFHTLPATQT